MYKTQRCTAELSISEYVDGYVNIGEFLEYCKECRQYGQVWSCPPYDFDVTAFWETYQTIQLIGTKIVFDEETIQKMTGKEAVEEYSRQVMLEEKQKLTEELWELEKKYPRSISLSAGSCHLCETCERPKGLPCTHAEQMRHSIESLGGNVGKTCNDLLGIKLLWSEEGRLPQYFVLVCALLVCKE